MAQRAREHPPIAPFPRLSNSFVFRAENLHRNGASEGRS